MESLGLASYVCDLNYDYALREHIKCKAPVTKGIQHDSSDVKKDQVGV